MDSSGRRPSAGEDGVGCVRLSHERKSQNRCCGEGNQVQPQSLAGSQQLRPRSPVPCAELSGGEKSHAHPPGFGGGDLGVCEEISRVPVQADASGLQFADNISAAQGVKVDVHPALHRD